jgi:hypothetical protein
MTPRETPLLFCGSINGNRARWIETPLVWGVSFGRIREAAIAHVSSRHPQFVRPQPRSTP